MTPEQRQRVISRLTPEQSTVYRAMPENGISATVSAICASVPNEPVAVRQILSTLCAKGLVHCNGEWCHRTKPSMRRA